MWLEGYKSPRALILPCKSMQTSLNPVGKSWPESVHTNQPEKQESDLSRPSCAAQNNREQPLGCSPAHNEVTGMQADCFREQGCGRLPVRCGLMPHRDLTTAPAWGGRGQHRDLTTVPVWGRRAWPTLDLCSQGSDNSTSVGWGAEANSGPVEYC